MQNRNALSDCRDDLCRPFVASPIVLRCAAAVLPRHWASSFF